MQATTQRWPAAAPAQATHATADTHAAPSSNRMQRPQFAGQQQQQFNPNFSMNSAQQQFQQQEAAGSPGGLGPGGPAPPQQMMHLDPEDPLLIAQSLTYVTDDGSVNLSFASAPFSFSFKLRFIILEALFIFVIVAAVPFGAHGTVVTISLTNLFVVAWFWYNSVRSVDILNDGALRFWIGNLEVDVPFTKIVEIRRLQNECSLVSPGLLPHRGYMTCPDDGVAIVTTVPSMPLFMWPRSAGKPERRLGPITCPRLRVVFSPTGGALSFIREVEAEMRGEGRSAADGGMGRVQPPAFVPSGNNGMRNNGGGGGGADLIDV